MRHFLLVTVALAAALLHQASAAQDADSSRNTLRLTYAKSSESDMATAFAGDFDASRESNYLLDATWGRRVTDTLFGLPIPISANVGVQYFNERGYQHDGLGGTAFIKAHYTWRLPFTNHPVRFGIGEGLSYVSRIPMSEQRDFAKKGAESEKLMNYLEWTVDVPFQLANSASERGGIEELSVGFVVWHRSSVFGLFAESGGGVNFMGVGIQARY